VLFRSYINGGSYNNFFGLSAGYNTTANHNNFFGHEAGFENTTGSSNTFIGQGAGRCNTTGSNNLLFGCGAGCTAAGLCNITTQSNFIIMGNSSHTCALIQTAWTAVSDIRDKCIFGTVPHGRGFLQGINPIAFAFKDRQTGCLTDPEGTRRYGFSAQEIAELEGDSKVIASAEDPEKLKITSDYLVPVLVNAVKELSAELDALKARVEALEA
jgi:hypothetical protein